MCIWRAMPNGTPAEAAASIIHMKVMWPSAAAWLIIDFEMKRRELGGEDGSFTATVRALGALAKQLL